VEVNRAPSLEFGHLRIRHADHPPEPGLIQADLTGQGTLDGDGRPPPELGGKRIPEDLRRGVIAGRAERLPQPWIILVVAMPAAIPRAMPAAGTLPVGVTGQHQAALGLAGVDPAEAGRGEGHEQPRMLVDRLRDALAALEPGGQQLVGISPVGGRTRRAPGLPAGAAGLQQHAVRLPVAVIDLPDFAGLAVGVLDPSGQADRVVAVAGLGDEFGPARVAVPGPLDDLGQHTRQDLAYPGRLAHAASPLPSARRSRATPATGASRSAGSARRPVVARMIAATWWWSTCGVRTRWKPGRPGRLVTATPT
jgi:hypothetical protein